MNHEFSNPIDWPRLATVGPILEILDVLNIIFCVRSNFSTICVIFSAPTVLRQQPTVVAVISVQSLHDLDATQ